MAKQAFMLGDFATYGTGGFVPEGDYALEFAVKMHQKERKGGQKVGEPVLSTVVTFHPLDGSAAIEQAYGMGNNAHKSFAPDPDTGTGIIAVAGGAGAPISANCKWGVFFKEFQDAGLRDMMPEGYIQNDLGPLSGIWVHIQNIPEPEEWSKIESKSGTNEVEGGGKRTPGQIPVVSEILDGGCPWDGGGGIPEKTGEEKKGAKKPAASAKVVPAKAPAKVAPAPTAKKPAAKVAPAKAVDDTVLDAVLDAALAGIGSALETKPEGFPNKPMLRASTFKAIKAQYEGDEETGAAMAQAVADAFFGSDEALTGLLDQVGYKLEGSKIVPA